MKLLEALSEKEKTLKVEYFKDSSDEIIAQYDGKSYTLDEFEEMSKTDKDIKILVRATTAQNKYYPKQVKRFRNLVPDLFHKRTKTPDVEVDKGKVTIYSGRKISSYDEPRVDTKEIKSSGSKDMEKPPWLRRQE